MFLLMAPFERPVVNPMLFLALYLAHAQVDPAWLPIEETFVQDILTAAGNRNYTLVLGVRISNMRPVRCMQLFDLKTKRALEIEDARMGSSITAQPMATRDGFAVLDSRQEAVYFLDLEGNFQASFHFRDIEGIEEGMRFIKAYPINADQWALTYRTREDPALMSLGLVSLGTKRLEPIFSAWEEEYLNAFWFSAFGRWYLSVPETGQLTLLDAYFKKEQALLEPGEPIPLAEIKGLKQLLRKHAASPYKNQYQGPVAVIGEEVYFRRLEKDSNDGGIWIYLSKSGVRSVKTDEIWIAGFEGRQLFFSRKKESFEIRSSDK